MNEIEFRVWDKRQNEFIEYWCGNLNDTLNDIFEDSNYDFIQYIGRKDKNGKKIFENDIVARYAEKDSDAYKKGDLLYIGLVVYEEKSCAFVVRCGFDFKIFESMDIEILGNIYENPELFE